MLCADLVSPVTVGSQHPETPCPPTNVCNRLIVLERCPMAEMIHPFYESHRGAMEAAMRHRLDLAEAMLCERAHLSNIDGIRQEVMDEFEIVLTQMPYVGGAASHMSDFFMRLMGFMAISRVLRRHGRSE